MAELPYPPTTVQLVDNRTKEAAEKRKQAKEALNEAAQTTPPDSYQIRDKVWPEAKHLTLPYQTPKLTPKCHGPFTFTKKVSPVTYQFKLPVAWTIHDIFHTSLLTPYRETTEHRTNYMRPPSDLIEDTKEYEVEAIVNHHHFGHKQQLQYLIKWKGYPDADNTWESVDHVHAPTLIQTYHWKNPLSPSEQDKKGQKKSKVSICSLKSYLQQHLNTTTITCPLLSNSTPPFTISRSLTQKSPLSNNPSTLSLAPPLLTNIPPTVHPSHLPSTLTPKKARSSHASTIMATPSPLKVHSMSSKGIPSLMWEPCAPSPSAPSNHSLCGSSMPSPGSCICEKVISIYEYTCVHLGQKMSQVWCPRDGHICSHDNHEKLYMV